MDSSRTYMRRSWCGARSWLLFLAALCAGAPDGPLGAQSPASESGADSTTRISHPGLRDPGGFPFRTPTHSALEPLIRFGVARVDRDTAGRAVFLPDLGDRLSFWLRRGEDAPWELAGAVAGGVFSRFDLESSDNEFIEVHYRVGLQLRARYRGTAARLEIYHVSSHLGDEFLERTGREPRSTSREGVEFLLQRAFVRNRGLFLYGGPGMLLRSTESFESPSLRAGGGWSPGEARSRWKPYAAVELFSWSELGWRPLLSAETGIRFGPSARLGLTLGAGPSRAEQFFREDETLIGVAFSFLR